jgi:hypothetical protein
VISVKKAHAMDFKARGDAPVRMPSLQYRSYANALLDLTR